jgi:hypothetical protein
LRVASKRLNTITLRHLALRRRFAEVVELADTPS